MFGLSVYVCRDASWECVPHAYQDLLVRHDTCDSASCSCPHGRKTNIQGTRWELILCKYCGSQGIHIGCGRLKWKSPEFQCDACCSSTNNETDNRNTRNYNGNRHRLSGGRTASVHPSVSADRIVELQRSCVEERTTVREGEAFSDSSNDSSHVTISNRRTKVVSPVPQPKVKSPPPKKKINLETSGKKNVISSIEIDDSDDDNKPLGLSITIDDSDDDVELVSETKGNRCLKTKDGSTIEVVHMESTGVQKRPRVERDIRVMPEVVELNIQMEGPPKKPKAVESPVVHQSSSSAAFSAPSTSFASQDRFVLVDPATLRPDELPPGTVLLRSVQPVVNMPQPQQPVPANVPVQQLGSPCSADAEHSDLCKHRPRCSYYLRSQHLLKKHLKKTSSLTPVHFPDAITDFIPGIWSYVRLKRSKKSLQRRSSNRGEKVFSLF
ncbi:ubiquitin-protein transferase activity protein [Homalodisca vitripennis]|nr:ubiquitin-protein transferase activity protein [Homalodisca vitripennis]